MRSSSLALHHMIRMLRGTVLRDCTAAERHGVTPARHNLELALQQSR
jgi:hypothetical protein